MPRTSKANQTPSQADIEEVLRLKGLSFYEEEARIKGHSIVAGVDEAGRGPLAGPVVAAVCILPEGTLPYGVRDSKQLTGPQREKIYASLTTHPDIDYGVGFVSPEEIDEINIYQASLKAMLLAIAKLSRNPDVILVDGINLNHPKIPCKRIVKGDSLSISIAAASIIAKVERDHLMIGYDKKWPEYGFKKHKGYGTEAHLKALREFGPCPIHRRSFSPVSVVCQDLPS